MSLKIKRGMGKRLGKINNSLIMFLLVSSIIIIPFIFASDSIIGNNINQSKIKINIEYNKNSSYDSDNDGIEKLDGIVDFNVENTEIDESLNESNLCTRWNVYSIENESSLTLCYGAEKCCNFIEMSPSSSKWDDIFYIYYGKYGATNNNEVSAQVIHVDYSLKEENPYSKVYYSKISSLDAAFRKGISVGTRITNYIEQNEISKGEIQNVYSTLQYVNDSAISLMNISLYLNNNLFETRTTDENGEALFEIDTSDLSPGNYSVDIRFDGIKIQKWNETIILMPSSNNSFMTVLPSNNESIYATENLKQGYAEIGKPVKWTKKINLENFANESRDVNLDFDVPEKAENIVVKKDDKEINEKRTGILSALLSLGRSEDGPLFEFSGTSKSKKNFVIKDKVNKSKTEYNIEYETPAPIKDEIFNVNGNAIKRIKIHSDVSFHYYNIKSYSDIPEGIENLRIYHLINNSKIDVTENPDYDVKFIDSDNNGLYDKVEWNVPMLSEQLFEIGVATVNTRKSIYHPGEEAEIIMVVLDKLGRLVTDADVGLIITSPSNETSHYSTSEQTIVETEEGIYEASYSETNAEGNYSLFVSALSDDVNSTMGSYFIVKDYYEFDILRDIPATTDPWIGDFDSSIRIISYNGAETFDFIELIPSEFNVTNNGGSITTMELNMTAQNLKWKAFVGNVSGKLTLADSYNYSVYDWTLSTVLGEVYATRSSTAVSWGSINCSNETHMYNEEVALSHTSNPDDNITATFNVKNHEEVYIGSIKINTDQCYSIHTNVNNESQDSDFEEIILYDGTDHSNGDIVYATILEQDLAGYNNNQFDFQMIVPENGAPTWTSSTPYYFYVELT